MHLRGSSGKVAYTRSVAKVLITEQEADEMSRNKNVKFNNGGWTQNKAKKNRPSRCLSSR